MPRLGPARAVCLRPPCSPGPALLLPRTLCCAATASAPPALSLLCRWAWRAPSNPRCCIGASDPPSRQRSFETQPGPCTAGRLTARLAEPRHPSCALSSREGAGSCPLCSELSRQAWLREQPQHPLRKPVRNDDGGHLRVRRGGASRPLTGAERDTTPHRHRAPAGPTPLGDKL